MARAARGGGKGIGRRLKDVTIEGRAAVAQRERRFGGGCLRFRAVWTLYTPTLREAWQRRPSRVLAAVRMAPFGNIAVSREFLETSIPMKLEMLFKMSLPCGCELVPGLRSRLWRLFGL